ncbi:hypothetical protein ACW7G3_07130 [Luteimonas sp. A478]
MEHMTMERLGGEGLQRVDRGAAALVSVSFNLVLLCFLNASLRSPGPHVAPAHDVIQLVWIEEAPDALPPSTEVAVPKQSNRSAREAEKAAPMFDKPLEAVEAESGNGTQTLDLSLPGGELVYSSRRIYAPGPSLPSAPEPRARFVFVDRSLGGTMQRMSKNRMCGELKFALTDSPESADAILASMKRIGCGERE